MPRATLLNARRMAHATGTALERRAARHMVFATLEPQPMLRRLRPDLVVDVGANRGQFALDVRRAVPHASIVSFEPLRSEADVCETVMSTDDNFTLHRFAIGPDPELPGLFWVAGLGGAGMCCSAAIGRVAAELLLGGATDAPLARALSPARLAQTGPPA